MGRTIAAVTVLVGLVAVAAGEPAAAPPTIQLIERTAQAHPVRDGCTYVGGGTFDVQSPSRDAVVINMIGAVVATAHPKGSSAVMDFDLTQCFEIAGGAPGGKLRLSLETQLLGVLRGGRIAGATASAGATVAQGENVIVTAGSPDRSAACGQNLTVNDRVAPDDVTILPGQYLLHAHCRLAASHPASLRGKSASAEFAPEPALDPIWVGGPRDPFHGIVKKDFGFRVTIHVEPEPVAGRKDTAPSTAAVKWSGTEAAQSPNPWTRPDR
jgi:hypothetical protein